MKHRMKNHQNRRCEDRTAASRWLFILLFIFFPPLPEPTVGTKRLLSSQRAATISCSHQCRSRVMKPFNIPECRLRSIMHQHAREAVRSLTHLYFTTGPLTQRISWQNKTIALIIGGQLSFSSGSGN